MKKGDHRINRILIFLIIILLIVTLAIILMINKPITGNVIVRNYETINCNSLSDGATLDRGTHRLRLANCPGLSDKSISELMPTGVSKLYHTDYRKPDRRNRLRYWLKSERDRNKRRYRNIMLPDDTKFKPGDRYKLTVTQRTILQYSQEQPTGEVVQLEQPESTANLEQESVVQLSDYFIVNGFEDGQTNEIEVSGAPGEDSISAVFRVFAPETMHDVTYDISTLTSGSNTISNENVEEYFLHEWDQNGISSRREARRMNVGEMLLKNDLQNLEGGFKPLPERYKSGVTGNALDTSDNYFHEYIKDTLDTSRGTIDLWVKPKFDLTENTDTNEIALIKGDKGSVRLYINKDILNDDGTTTEGGYLIFRYKNALPTEEVCPAPNPPIVNDVIASCRIKASEALSQNQFSRITGTWDVNEGVQLFIDGEIPANINCINNGITKISEFNSMYVGGIRERNTFNGAVDELKIFDSKLTQSQIAGQNIRVSPTRQQNFENFNSNNNFGEAYVYDYREPQLSETLITKIPKGKTRTFWVKIKIPEGTPAGEYTANINTHTSNGPSKSISLKLKVHPFELEEPKQDRLIWISHTPESQEGREFVINDIKGYFNSLKLNLESGEENEVSAELQSWIDSGLTPENFNGAILPTNFKYKLMNLVNAGFEHWMFGVDETKGDARHISLTKKWHGWDAKVGTFLEKEYADKLGNPTDPIHAQIDPETCLPLNQNPESGDLDLAIYHGTNLRKQNRGADQDLWDYIQNLRSGTEQKDPNKKEYFYWQGWQESPGTTYSSYQRGMVNLVATTPLDGIAIWSYQAPAVGPNNNRGGIEPFNDFSGTTGNNGIKTRYKHKTTTYPAKNNIISTKNWEAIKAGINDLRYIATLEKKIENLQTSNPNLANQISSELETQLAIFLDPVDYEQISYKQFQDLRDWIAQKIIEIDQTISIDNVVTTTNQPTNLLSQMTYPTTDHVIPISRINPIFELPLFKSRDQPFINTLQKFRRPRDHTYAFAVKPTNTNLMTILSGTTGDNFYPKIITDQGNLKYSFRTSRTRPLVFNTQTPPDTIKTNEWNYIVITHKQPSRGARYHEVRIYVNGELIIQKRIANRRYVRYGRSNLHIGGSANLNRRNVEPNFIGEIKNVLIYNRILSNIAIQDHSNYCDWARLINEPQVTFGDLTVVADCHSSYTTDPNICGPLDRNNDGVLNDADVRPFAQCLDQ